jgi:predicted permease
VNWLRRIWHWKELDQQLDKELLYHLEEHIADLVANGLDPKEARRQALIELGGPEQVKESCREVRGAGWLRDLSQDLRYALRTLRLHPGFTAVAILTLGLGIGITTVMFTIANGVLLKPLPYLEPERLVSLHEGIGSDKWSLSYPNFQDVKQESLTLAPMAAWRNNRGVVSSPGAAEYVPGRQISAGLFALYGVQLPHGREFSQEDDRPGSAPVAIIGQSLWRSRYQKNPGTVGRELVLDGKSYTVVGIAPAGFKLDGDVDVYIPLGQDTSESMRNRDMHVQMSVLARLRPGVSIDMVRSELQAISRRSVDRYPKSAKHSFTSVPMQSEMVENVQSTLGILLGAVVLVLLIGCANLASLLLVRAAAREREVAMRIALGAGRGRLIRQCLTESLVIALLGGMLGAVLAAIGIRPFLALWPGGLPRAEEIQLDWRILLFALVISLISSLLFGLAPALRAPTSALEQALRAGSRMTGGPRKLHTAFVASEIAITIVLLVSAGMLGRALIRLSRLDPGIDAHNVLTAQVNLSSKAHTDPAKIRAAWQEIIEGLRRTQGVDSAGVTDILPMSGSSDTVGYWTSSTMPSPDKMPMSLLYAISPDYMKVMRMTLCQGRFITEQDRLDGAPVAVIDEVLAKRSFPGQDAVGRYLWVQMLGPVKVIGVITHVRHWGLSEKDNTIVREQIYFPFAQIPDKYMRVMTKGLYLVVRTSVPPMSLVDAVQQQVRSYANDQVIYSMQPMETIMRGSLAQHRFLMVLFGIFAGLALLLAGIGIYGVISYLTKQRMREFGVRMALGAKAGDVVLLALKQSTWMIVLGVVAGSAASLITARALSSAAGVPAYDPWTFASMVALLILIALIASFLPARRAGRMDPAKILRQE